MGKVIKLTEEELHSRIQKALNEQINDTQEAELLDLEEKLGKIVGKMAKIYAKYDDRTHTTDDIIRFINEPIQRFLYSHGHEIMSDIGRKNLRNQMLGK